MFITANLSAAMWSLIAIKAVIFTLLALNGEWRGSLQFDKLNFASNFVFKSFQLCSIMHLVRPLRMRCAHQLNNHKAYTIFKFEFLSKERKKR